MTTKEMKQLLESETDGNELYDLLIDCGKKYSWTAQEKDELKKVILKYCDHPSEQARSAAIRVLCFYWGLEEYRDKAWEMFSRGKEDDEVRSDALMSWANTYRNQNKISVLKKLYSILKQKSYEKSIREASYWAILGVSSLPPQNWPKKDIDWDHFDKDIDWTLLETIINQGE
ncbi:hypothetical protein [Chryseobacterium defluvii]|uniref:HEAT repeat protein n=1 Tax=Chryseobacterium defluvii TaxID=160396 RepID=A0A495SA65_9FLAO|nr:hypothetical protein [Chryseobacterium defluvii]RKS96391.1 hypothetical protein BCF58_2815 [Chryseobacterium defluvii]